MSRSKKRLKQKRWRFAFPWRFVRWTSALSLVAFLSWGAYSVFHWFTDQQNFPLNTVEIEAPYQHVSKKRLEQIVKPYIKTHFLTLDASNLHQKLSAIPWVKSVQLKRVWPDTLWVRVVEQQPFARWGSHGVVNNEGEVFYVDAASIPPNLPTFSGPRDMTKKMVQHHKEFQALLEKEDLKMAELRVNSRHAWELVLEDGVLIKLGQAEQQARLSLVVQSWSVLNKGRKKPLSVVDARYANGIAVK